MNIFGKPVELVNKEDIENLVERTNLEARYFDFKESLNSDNPTGVLEQITSFANHQGGMIVYGIKEEKGEVENHYSITGIQANIDNLILDMENTMRDQIRPRIANVKIHPVKISDEIGYVLIIYAPRSYRFPHVVGQNKWTFYTRNSVGKHPCDIEEVRQLFLQSEDFGQKARAWVKERLELIQTREIPRVITNPHQGNVILHLIPLDSLYQRNSFDLQSVRLRPFGFDSTYKLFPSTPIVPFTETYNLDGRIFYLIYHPHPYSRTTQLFRNGMMEAVDTWLLNYARIDQNQNAFDDDDDMDQGKKIFPIHGEDFAKRMYLEIRYGLQNLKEIGIQGPILVQLTLQNVDDYYFMELKAPKGVPIPRRIERRNRFDRPTSNYLKS